MGHCCSSAQNLLSINSRYVVLWRSLLQALPWAHAMLDPLWRTAHQTIRRKQEQDVDVGAWLCTGV